MAKSPKSSNKKTATVSLPVHVGDPLPPPLPPVPPVPPSPPPCAPCADLGSGIAYCEDGVMSILAWPTQPSYLVFDPTVSALPFWQAQ